MSSELILQAIVSGLLQLLKDLGKTPKETGIDTLMQQLIALRAEARKAKNFAVSDQIRKRLTDLGVTLEDRPGGTIWRVG